MGLGLGIRLTIGGYEFKVSVNVSLAPPANCTNPRFNHSSDCSKLLTVQDDNNWVKKCKEYEVVGSRPRGRPKRTWLEVVQGDCQVRGLSKDDAIVRGRWRKMIRIVDEHEGCEWMDVS